ncbi:precorrin-6A synthase (deacetylating) [Longimycelium tulufanense]|uniref:precorrin-6A synthase (deacetylating) n=1 Tax=Longimycelium tulufanense TaxID=907463 RepID=UPI00166CAD4A|nr:precorrin-6A synthase (deacetylating) [Longimycelium tulufanense]
MRKVYLIGIGAGNPEHLTVQAVNALNEVDVFFVLDKGSETEELVRLRREILERYVPDRPYRVVQVNDPRRDRTAKDYVAAVEDWRQRRVELYEQLIRDELTDGSRGAVLVWGDPALYDSTVSLFQALRERAKVEFAYEVIPGVSSLSALVAGHRTTFNQIGRPVLITTGRQLARGLPADVDDVLVMLDAHCTFHRFVDEDLEIFWGAYVGTPDEILISGRLRDVAEEIQHVRSRARQEKGWIMDSYLLRRLTPAAPVPQEHIAR